MELTKEWVANLAWGAEGGPRKDPTYTAIDALWQAIEADRQRVRDEAIAEVKKDHYAVGDRAELLADFWEPVVFGFQDKYGNFVDDISNGSFHFRRPPKTRPMTDMEKARAWVDNYAKKYPGNPWETLSNILLSGATIDDACESDNVSTEVTDETP